MTANESAAPVRALIDAQAPLPTTGRDAAALLQETAQLLFDHARFNGYPRFLGYGISMPAPIGVLGDLGALDAAP